MKVAELISFLATKAPLNYQESYDNAGLIFGDPEKDINKVLISLDVTEAVIDEAISTGCQMVVAHHPLIFGGVKQLSYAKQADRCLIKAIQHGIALYAIHTNLDHVSDGVNAMICHKLGLDKTTILAPKKDLLSKLTFFVPHSHKQAVTQAVWAAGAGNIGEYSDCSFQLDGKGTFRPSDAANPHIGQQGQLERIDEARVEVLLESRNEHKVLSAMRAAHPYEEVAYYLHKLSNKHQQVGAGMVGCLPEPIPTQAFLRHLKQSMELVVVKHTALVKDTIHKVAVCGGSGSFLLKDAIRAKADIFISSDWKYHQFFDAEQAIIIADIGHYESEKYTSTLLQAWLTEAFPRVSCSVTTCNTNPVSYFIE